MNVSPASHLLLNYNREKVYRRNIGLSAAKKLEGMSRCGLWRHARSGSAHERFRGQLAGILTEYRERPLKVIVAVRFQVILEALRQTVPEMATVMRAWNGATWVFHPAP